MAVPTAKYLKVQAYAAWGSELGSEDKVLDFTESTSITGNRKVVITKEYATSATDQSVDLSTFVDTATWIIVQDNGGTGINVGAASGGTKLKIAANKLAMWANSAATPPTLYFDNPDGSNRAYITIIVLGASA